MESSGAESDGWDESQAVSQSAAPISISEFEALSLRERGQIPRRGAAAAPVNVYDWFNGGKSSRNASIYSTPLDLECHPVTPSPSRESDGGFTDDSPVQPYFNTDPRDKAYVEEYMKELDHAIYQISMNPNSAPVGVIPGQRTMWIDPDPVYAAFDMDLRNASVSALAVYAYKDDILQALRDHQVLIVEGFTGCGKTTQIPQYILDDFATRGKLGNIVVTQPRRIAAQSVADRVCKERQWVVGDLVGYQVGLNKRTTDRTRLTYVTTGVLLQSLISKKSLRDYTHIIVDEVHERDLDTDLLILVLKKLMVETADTTTKIILMSATLNAEKFGDYFPKWFHGRDRLKSKIIRIPQTTFYAVHEHYLDTLRRLGPKFEPPQSAIHQDIGYREPAFQSNMYELTVNLLEALDDFERRAEESERGGVLAFLPGLLEIDTMYKKCLEYLEGKLEKNNQDLLKWTILPLHSTITAEEQQKVFHSAKLGHRKIILATNIAESSITVTDIKYVIDFCLTKSVSCDPQTNYSCLRLEWASQDQCVQRRGRVGRVSEGHVFRMLTQKGYNSLQKETVPDMEKACLENVILSVKALDLGSPTSVMALAIDAPAQSAIKLAICNLKEVGALTIEVSGVYNAYDGDLTELGILMTKLPFDIRYSRLIALGHVFGVLEEAVIIAAGLSVKSAFSFPFSQRLMAYMSKLMWAHEAFSDCFAIVNLFRTWIQKNSSGELRNYDQLRKWKHAYFVQTNALREINLCIEDVIRRLANYNCHMAIDMNHLTRGEMTAEQGLMLKIAIAGAFYPNYFVRHRPEPVEYKRQIARELVSHDPHTTIFYSGFPNEQPGDLYATHIAEKFESLNSVPYISVYGGKVLVQFDPRGDNVGPLSINLFRGVKMRQLRQELRFAGVRSDTAHRICDEEKSYYLNRILKPPKQCILPGVGENSLLVSVTRMDTPGNFWILYQNELTRFNEIADTIAESISGCKQMIVKDAIPGFLCIAKHESNYFRARVEYVTTYKGNMMLSLIDVGNVIWREPRECFLFSQHLIDLRLHKYPALGIKCRLQGIKPLDRYAGIWSEQACKLMVDNLSKNNNVVVMEVYSVVEGIIACDIFGRGSDGVGKDDGIRKMLLTKGLAAQMEESTASRDNHSTRRRYTRDGQLPPAELERFIQLQLHSDPAPPILLTPPGTKNCTHEFVLKGPHSPLEMKFRALSASTHTKTVIIDGYSINSVALDDNPSAPTCRVMVAASIGISQKTGSVILRETTILPPIPGLAQMLTLIFCPMMQLHADSWSDRYTGCISGLGKDYATNASVYPDHDVEVVFDTVFDQEDIHMINGIRVIMNLVLNGKQTSKITIPDLRKGVRDHIRKLLERSRKAVDQVHPLYEFVWRDDPIKNPVKKHVISSGIKRSAFSLRPNEVFPVHSLDVLPTNLPESVSKKKRGRQADAGCDFLRS